MENWFHALTMLTLVGTVATIGVKLGRRAGNRMHEGCSEVEANPSGTVDVTR